ncbi:MAG TPA: SDR family oxidoreductase, partial [Candidatus Thermoplasmatota archaeon]
RLMAGAPALAGRIDLMRGDITRPRLGLDGPPPARVRQVWHLAAAYDLTIPRGMALRVNRDGTRHVLALAAGLKELERFHHVSTCYVSGHHPGTFSEADLDIGQTFNNHYEETKYLAELEVRAASQAGLPVTVYRPSVVVGDSVTGETPKLDGPYFVVRLLLRQGQRAVVPVFGEPASTHFNAVPRDWVVEAMARLATRGDTVGRTFHLAEPEPETIAVLLEAMAKAAGKTLVPVRLPLALAKWATSWVPGVGTLTGVPAEAMDYFDHPTRYATAATQDALGGYAPPRFVDLLPVLVDFVRRNPGIGSEAMA